MRIQLWFFFGLILTSTSLIARDNCGLQSRAGSSCWAKVLSIRPTQFSVGIREVSEKETDLEELGANKQDKYLEEHPAPLVIGPEGGLFIIDHHHLARAVWQADLTDMAFEVKENWSNLAPKDFWDRMIKSKYVYLYDQFGHGPLDVKLLPESVVSLADDWYRSLAGYVRKEGGYSKSAEPFAEFKWANFFRTRVPKVNSDRGFKDAVKAAAKLAHSPDAKDLPGYLP